MLSVPSIDADIDAARTLALAREIAPLTLVHTRTKVLDSRQQNIVDGTLAELIRTDLELRKSLAMPPYTREVRIVCSGSKAKVIKDARLVIDTLRLFKPKPQPELVRESETQVSHTTTLSFPLAAFPPPNLIELLHTLPAHITVSVV
jgi:primosomal protein N'